MSITVYDNGYEAHIRGVPDADPWTIREYIIEAPAGTPDAELEKYATAHHTQNPAQDERFRFFEDEEADEDGPACRLLRVFYE